MKAYAIVECSGGQEKVHAGDIIDVDRVPGEPGSSIELDRVLARNDGSGLEIGTPVLADRKVTAEIVEQIRGDKVVSFKKKRRKGYRRKVGHRQEQTRLKIVEC